MMMPRLALDRRTALLGAAACALPLPSLASDAVSSVPTEDTFWRLAEAARAVCPNPNDLPCHYRAGLAAMSRDETYDCLDGLASVYARIHTPEMRRVERLLLGFYDGDNLLALTWGLIHAGRTFCDAAIRDPETMAGHVPTYWLGNFHCLPFDEAQRRVGHDHGFQYYPEMPPPELDWTDDQLRRRFPRLAAWAPTFASIEKSRCPPFALNV